MCPLCLVSGIAKFGKNTNSIATAGYKNKKEAEEGKEK